MCLGLGSVWVRVWVHVHVPHIHLYSYFFNAKELNGVYVHVAENDTILTEASAVLLNFIVSLIYLVLNIHVLVHTMCP